ncbi:SAM-dependent methyltransferase [Legionella sp. W05-934-2]|uniref:SAM-dependent methyltransferase n=1 Tax=Legionella sp. W05-934-2 TaxID=1198649 RepID=UPI00346230BA
MKLTQSLPAIYVAKTEYLGELCEELRHVDKVVGNLVFSPTKSNDICFALDTWLDPHIVPIESISQAVKILRQAGPFWYLHPISHIRRSKLIEAQLRNCPELERSFPVDKDLPNIGVFSLLDNNTLLYCVSRKKKWPDGACFFREDKINPPNRAYLKLWESLFLINCYPKPGDKVLDLGASPGGWTYVMQSLGAQVTSVDKSELDSRIQRLPRIEFLKQSAFALDPNTLNETYDWVLSDIACYPERAYDLIQRWIQSGKAKRMIVTIKLQGKTNLSVIQSFQKIPNSRLTHLFHNKHEVTFFYPNSLWEDN